MTISKLKSFFKLLRYFAEEIGPILIVPGSLVAIGALFYLFSSPSGQNPREFTGKIVDKKVSGYESEKGSSFVNELVIEEKNGRRFVLSVTGEMYGQASIGMWIKRSKNSLDLQTDPDQKESP